MGEITSGRGAIFIQRDGANTPLEYIGCHGATGLSEDEGSVTRGFCIDDEGNYATAVETVAPPSDVGFSIVQGHSNLASVMDGLRGCNFNVYFAHSVCGKPSQFTKYDTVIVAKDARRNSVDYGNYVAFDTDERLTKTYAVTAAPPLINAWRLNPYILSYFNIMTSGGSFRSLAACKGGSCGNASCSGKCSRIWAVYNSGTQEGRTAYIDSRGAWKTTVKRPFQETDVDWTAQLITCLSSGRLVAVHAATTIGGHLGFSYSDDNGFSWTDYIPNTADPGTNSTTWSIFSRKETVWVGAAAGYIYRSVDSGATWVAVEPGVLSSATYTSIHFMDDFEGYAVSADSLVKSLDGGETWVEITAPAVSGMQAVWTTSEYLWVDGTKVWYRKHTDSVWTERKVPLSYPTSVAPFTDIKFANDYVGVILQTGTTGDGTKVNRILYCVTGGAENTWIYEDLGAAPPPITKTDGFAEGDEFAATRIIRDIVFCGEHTIFAAGDDALSLRLSAFK